MVVGWRVNGSVPHVPPSLAQTAPMCGPSATDARASTGSDGIMTVGISIFAGRRRGADDAHLAAALTSELARQLLSARRVSQGSTRGVQNNPLLVVKAAEGGSVSDVDLSLTGSVFRDDSLVRTSVRVIRTRDGVVLWTGARSRPLLELPILARVIGQEFASRIGARLSTPAPMGATERSPDVYELMLRGAYYASGYAPEDLVRAIGYFDEAVARDPRSTGARSQRETAQLRLLAWGGDGSPSEAHLLARGLLRRVSERDRDESERLVEEADEETRGGQAAHACELLNAAIENDARSTPAYALRSLVRSRRGDVRDAFTDAETVTQLGRPVWGNALRVVALRRAGDATTAKRLMDQLLAQTRQRRGTLAFWDARFLATGLSELGDYTTAQAVLHRIDVRDPRIAWLESDPALQRLAPTARSTRPAR